jgi:hypothetical protein
MPGLVPGIHVFEPFEEERRGLAGTSPAMTRKAARFQDGTHALELLAAFLLGHCRA